jgi:hypothetical protein
MDSSEVARDRIACLIEESQCIALAPVECRCDNADLPEIYAVDCIISNVLGFLLFPHRLRRELSRTVGIQKSCLVIRE